MEENSRKEEIKNTLLDTATEEVKCTGSKAVKTVIHDIEDWIAERYKELKKPKIDTEKELEKLQMEIDQHNRILEIGERKKEIAVMWAMWKLGYSKEDTKRVLDLANEVYTLKETEEK